MIYLAYSYSWQALFALYGEVMIRCFDTESRGQFNRDTMNLAMDTTSAERRQVHPHFWPEHRGICWSKKIPYSEQVWDDLLRHGTILD